MSYARFMIFATVVFAGVELVGWRFLFPSSFHRTFDAVDRTEVGLPDRVEVGELDIGGRRTCQVEVTNHKGRTIRLEQPQSECGCIRFDLKQSVTIRPGETKALSFQYEAPLLPGHYQKNVLLRVATAVRAWKIPVACDVSGDAWARPDRLAAQYSDSGPTETGGVLHFAEPKKLGRVVCSAPGQFKVRGLGRKASTTHRFEIEFAAGFEGDGAVSFHDAVSDEVLIAVPIEWRKPKTIECCPNTLVWNTATKGAEYQVTVIHTSGKNSQISITPKVPWVTVSGQKIVNDRVIRFSIAPVEKNMPSQFNGEIVQVVDSTSGQVQTVNCRL